MHISSDSFEVISNTKPINLTRAEVENNYTLTHIDDSNTNTNANTIVYRIT